MLSRSANRCRGTNGPSSAGGYPPAMTPADGVLDLGLLLGGDDDARPGRGDASRAKGVWDGVASRLQATFGFERIADPAALLADDDIDLSIRACLALAAARRAADTAERDRWIAQAAADDILRTVVNR